MIETLYKKAKGYDVEEISSEYSVDENGQKVLIREKRTVKHVPPDLASIKAYMELKDAEIYGLDSEELKKEKIRLLKELKAEEAKCKKKK